MSTRRNRGLNTWSVKNRMAESEETADPPLSQMEMGEAPSEEEEVTTDTGQPNTKKKQAKAKNPCLKCGKQVTRNSVRCRTCQLWVHVPCGNISKELFSILANPTKYGGVSWCCDCCQASAAVLESKMIALQNRFQEVEETVNKNSEVTHATARRVDNVERRQDQIEERLHKEREEYRRERNEEERERASRRKNVVFHGIGEAEDSMETAEERRQWDVLSCENICNALKVDVSSKDIKFCRRIGVRSAEPRPLVVGFRRESNKDDILDCAWQLKNTKFNNVNAVPDLTREQRKEEAELTREAERRNGDRTTEEVAKNVEWQVVGRKGEKRLVRGMARGRGGWATGANRTTVTPGMRASLLPASTTDRTRTEGGLRGRGGALYQMGRGTERGRGHEKGRSTAHGSQKRPRPSRRESDVMTEGEEEDEPAAKH